MQTKVPKSLLNVIYKMVIRPHIAYCITVWGYAPVVHIDKVQRLQNSSACCQWDVRLDHTKHRYCKILNWQTVRDRGTILRRLMYMCMAGTLPFSLSSHFNDGSHEYFTRGSMYDLDVPMPNREIFRQSIVYQGADAWNGLDNAIKCRNTNSPFKHLYKARTCI